MEILDQYLKLEGKIHSYFSYQEDWHVYPLSDSRNYYWAVDEEDDSVYFTEEKVESLDEEATYKNEILRDRFLPKSIYRGLEFTMIVVNTRTDGNKFLQIFDNSKEVKYIPYDENQDGLEENY